MSNPNINPKLCISYEKRLGQFFGLGFDKVILFHLTCAFYRKINFFAQFIL